MKEWKESIATLIKRREVVFQAGGEERLLKQHSQQKLTARERLEALFDNNSFTEINDMVLSRVTDFGMDKKKKLGDGVDTARRSTPPAAAACP